MQQTSAGGGTWTHADTDQEEAARLVASHNLLAIPVVDDQNKLVGTITVDDVIDVIKDETTEDIQKLGGLEALDEPYLQTPFWTLVKRRGRWLVYSSARRSPCRRWDTSKRRSRARSFSRCAYR